MKKCTSCKIEKAKSYFGPRKGSKDGFRAQCKDCVNARLAKYRNKNRKSLRGYLREYAKNNSEKISNYQKEYYESNKDQIIETSRKRYAENKDEINLKRRDKYANNIEDAARKRKEYRRKNRENMNARRREYCKKRYDEDVIYKLSIAIRNRINRAVKETGDFSAIGFLGCSVDILKEHLELKFYPNPRTGEAMTWSNHSISGWHIDHIIPLSAFDLTNEEDFKTACNYKNLQPMWYFENISKGGYK